MPKLPYTKPKVSMVVDTREGKILGWEKGDQFIPLGENCCDRRSSASAASGARSPGGRGGRDEHAACIKLATRGRFHCAYHCRTCGAHFTSLEAFDGHREGPVGGNRTCSFPDSAELVELTGTCKISDPLTPTLAVTIYSTERAARARDYFEGTNAAQTASANAKRATAA